MRISTVGPLPPAPHDYMPHAKAFGNKYMRISTVGPLPPAPHDYMPHAKAFGNYVSQNIQ